jgi:hypothetical protein
MGYLVFAIIVFNALDAILSLIYIKNGSLIEGNPLMEHILLNVPFLFFTIKIFIIPGLLIFLLKKSNYFLSKIGIITASFVYGLLMLIWIKCLMTY